MSRRCAVDNLMHASLITPARADIGRAWLLPALRPSMRELVSALAELHGPETLNRVRYEPDAQLEAQFGSYPPLRTPKAEAAGFRNDSSLSALLSRALE